MDVLPILAFTTFGAVIAFAIWSKARTEKELSKDDHKPSSLARSGPDPRYKPDLDVTDPFGVMR